jgi:flavodoxin
MNQEVIVYGSMFGNTHAIADAVGKGLAPVLEVVVVHWLRQAASGWSTPTCSWLAGVPIFTA